MRIVLDTNVLISAALKGGFSEDILQLSKKADFSLLYAEDILAELRRKLVTKFGWKQNDIADFYAEIRELCEFVEVKEKLDAIKNDPNDNRILECAVAGKADLIVSADQDLIKLQKFRGIGIVHPKTLAWTFPAEFVKHSKKK